MDIHWDFDGIYFAQAIVFKRNIGLPYLDRKTCNLHCSGLKFKGGMSVKQEIIKVSIELQGDSAARYKELLKITEATSHGDLLKDTLRLYEYVIKAHINGSEFLSRSPDGRTEVLDIFEQRR